MLARGALDQPVEIGRRLREPFAVRVPSHLFEVGVRVVSFGELHDVNAETFFQEEIDALREVLAFAFETSLMMGQARQMVGQAQQTDITRKLAAWAAILAVPTAVAGIYGMNFKYMPELEWPPGYFVVLAAILVTCVALHWRFRQTKWL